jgi:hypothetical protein
MAIITNGAGSNIASSVDCLYQIIDFLRTNSQWQIIGSGDGTTGGMGTPGSPIDVVNSSADLSNANFWLVWQLGTTIQMLLQREAASGAYSIYSNIAVDYSGGSATVRPTSVSGAARKLNGADISSLPSAGNRIHILCQDGSTRATAGWFAFTHISPGGSSSSFSMGFIPLVNTQTSDLHDYALAVQYSGSKDMTSFDYYQSTVNSDYSNGTLYSVNPFDPTTTTNYLADGCARALSTLGLNSANQDLGQASNGDDWRWPCVVMKPTGQYKGLTTFMQRVGTARAILSLWDSRSRVSFGSISLPWDGVSVPTLF